MRDSLRDAERLVGAIGLAPRCDFLTAHTDDAGHTAAHIHGPAQSIERRRVVVVHAQSSGIGRGIPRPGNLVRRRKSTAYFDGWEFII
jgi:hypothetical protein